MTVGCGVLSSAAKDEFSPWIWRCLGMGRGGWTAHVSVCGVCFPQRWSSPWASAFLLLPRTAAPSSAPLPVLGPTKTGRWSYQGCNLSSPALPRVSLALQAPALPLACANTERRGKESDADFVCPFPPIASSWVVDHS